MTQAPQLIAETIKVADGEIVGRVRLQKVFYLLEQLGLKSGLQFSYHHYGPYSRELDEALDVAKAFCSVKEVIRNRRSDGAAFSAFVLEDGADVRSNGHLGALSTVGARSYLNEMKQVSSTVIELSATIYWLVVSERVQDWRSELVRRKGVKTEAGRTEQALGLLRKLGLDGAIPT